MCCLLPDQHSLAFPALKMCHEVRKKYGCGHSSATLIKTCRKQGNIYGPHCKIVSAPLIRMFDRCCREKCCKKASRDQEEDRTILAEAINGLTPLIKKCPGDSTAYSIADCVHSLTTVCHGVRIAIDVIKEKHKACETSSEPPLGGIWTHEGAMIDEIERALLPPRLARNWATRRQERCGGYIRSCTSDIVFMQRRFELLDVVRSWRREIDEQERAILVELS